MADFFVSYNFADEAWAEWIAWTLEAAGYSTILQAWDFRSGDDFVRRMQQAISESDKTIAVLSENYLKAKFTHSEWAAAFAKDPTGEDRVLLPVRVCDFKPGGIFATRIYVDLVGLSEENARANLLGALSARGKPAAAPAYPGQQVPPGVAPHAVSAKKAFPGRPSASVPAPSIAMVQHAAAHPDARALNAEQVVELHHKLDRLRAKYFNMVIFAVGPPVGRVQPMPAAQDVRTKELLDWAKKGKKLDEIRSAIDAVAQAAGDDAFEAAARPSPAANLTAWQFILIFVLLLLSSAYFLTVGRQLGYVFVSLVASLVLFGFLSSFAQVENRLGKFGGPAALFIAMLALLFAYEEEPWDPCAEVAAGAAMSGREFQNNIVEEVESSPQKKRHLLRLDDAVNGLYEIGSKLPAGTDHEVYVYRTQDFANDVGPFSIGSETFRNSSVKLRIDGYLVSNDVPEFIEPEEPSQNNDLLLRIAKKGASRADQVVVLILAWGPRGALPQVGNLRFNCR